MAADASALDAARFFTTDPLHGALLDRNGDGVPDDLRVRLVVLGTPTTEEWVELIHLAARLGLETAGLTLPLATSSDGSLPADARPLFFLAEGADEVTMGESAMVVRGAAALRALWRMGVEGEAGADSTSPVPWPAGTPLDLARLYETDGALADDDGDLFAERVRLCLVVPRELPVGVGLALIRVAS